MDLMKVIIEERERKRKIFHRFVCGIIACLITVAIVSCTMRWYWGWISYFVVICWMGYSATSARSRLRDETISTGDLVSKTLRLIAEMLVVGIAFQALVLWTSVGLGKYYHVPPENYIEPVSLGAVALMFAGCFIHLYCWYTKKPDREEG